MSPRIRSLPCHCQAPLGPNQRPGAPPASVPLPDQVEARIKSASVRPGLVIRRSFGSMAGSASAEFAIFEVDLRSLASASLAELAQP